MANETERFEAGEANAHDNQDNSECAFPSRSSPQTP